MRITILNIAITLLASAAFAHPGSAIAVSADGRVYFGDTGGGNYVIERNGKLVRVDGPAFHWFALDAAGRFRATRWPSLPNADFQSAGSLVLSSDFPVTIGGDGKLYVPTPGRDGRIHIVGIQPSGERSELATLPVIKRGNDTITWLNGLAPGPGNSLYYTEDRAVKRIDAKGHITTIASNIAVPQCAAIPTLEPHLGPYLRGLAVAPDGTVYVAASGCGAVMKIDPKGNGQVILRTTSPWAPTGVAFANGEIYVLEYTHDKTDDRRHWMPRVRKIARNGAVTKIGSIDRR